MRRGSNGRLLAQHNRRTAEEFAYTHRQMFLDLLSNFGGGPRRLARALNDAGVPCRNGGRWHSTTVIRMLRYLGESFQQELKEARARAVEERFRQMGVPMR